MQGRSRQVPGACRYETRILGDTVEGRGGLREMLVDPPLVLFLMSMGWGCFSCRTAQGNTTLGSCGEMMSSPSPATLAFVCEQQQDWARLCALFSLTSLFVALLFRYGSEREK